MTLDKAGSLMVSGNQQITGGLNVGTVNVTGNQSINGNLNVRGTSTINNMPFSYSGIYFFDYNGGGTQVITQLPTNLPDGKYLFAIPEGPSGSGSPLLIFFTKSGSTFTKNTSGAPDGYDTHGSSTATFQASTYSNGNLDLNGTISMSTAGWGQGRRAGTWTVTQDLRLFPRTQQGDMTGTKTF